MKEIEAKDKKKLDAILKKYDYELIAGKPPKMKPLWITPFDTIYEYLKQPIIANYFSREIEKFDSFDKYSDALELAKIILFLGGILNIKQKYPVRMEYDIKGSTYKCKIEKNPCFIREMFHTAQKLLKEEDSLSFIGIEQDDADMEFSQQEIKFIINELEKKPKTAIQELGNRANTLQFRFNRLGLLSNVGTKGKGIVKELAFLYDYINELIKGNDTNTLSNKDKSDNIKNAINSYLKWKTKTARPEGEDVFDDIEMWEK